VGGGAGGNLGFAQIGRGEGLKGGGGKRGRGREWEAKMGATQK